MTQPKTTRKKLNGMNYQPWLVYIEKEADRRAPEKFEKRVRYSDSTIKEKMSLSGPM